ncbi:SusC/RagA family TonB-linked outer membrane protein [Sinomicrobium weinanense]|uniref:TonB-dependent receptor n=1 Tax=Sinomicrobium weinanense TaxID=2842200 RepID=A0A926JU17_9FLAO|nr:TonB-dependent receptor [Sinomicrobium weinanense]MBC9797232.1 TonB-dependent receptor [Sinomicrobium weinanense]MBU3125555.1 TonB-dependent receptor [Sinomicrobium weinanense]
MKTTSLKQIVPFIALFCAWAAQAQVTVSGKVSDASGSLPGANIVVKGTTNGTQSDLDGNFTLEDVEEDAVLVFSYIGFKSQEVAVNGRNTINVTLAEDAEGLDEVVVVGYGTQKKENLTGSVDVISGDRLKDRAANNVADLVKGASPNLNISMNMRGGEPGTASNWNIRGMGSLEGNASPLILVDGVEMNINNVDPESIESVSILKDASASAVYGSRAPFGVILITTKKGKKTGGVSVQYTNNLSFSSPVRLPSFVDSYTWATAYNQAAANAGMNAVYSDEQMERIRGYQDGTFPYEYDPENPIDNIWGGRRNGNANNDWPHVLMGNTAFNQKHNINVSGGNERNQFYISGGYVEENGLYSWGNDSYKRYNFMGNYNAEITSWLKFNSSVKYASKKTDYPIGFTTVGREHFFNGMLTFAPMMPFYNINGTVQSPLVRNLQGAGRDKGYTNDFFITLGGELEPVKGWKTSFTFNYNNQGHRSTSNPRPVPVELGTGEFGNIGKAISGYESAFSQNIYKMINGITSYENTFNRHYLKAMVGYEQEYRYYTGLTGSGSNLINVDVPSISTSLGERNLDDLIYHWATQGVFGRINYNFDEKYLLEFSARYNGSSRFASGNRWGFFPSGSLGYAISKESFWEPIRDYVNNLKIRVSYGALGNQNVTTSGTQNVRNYRYLATIPTGSQLRWIIDGERPAYADVPALISDDLTWETITSFNIGVDAAFLDNRLNLTFDWYNRVTSDMVGPALSLPYQLGTAAPRTNNAELSTRGYEIVLSWKDRPSPQFGYNASVSLGDNRSKILKYRNDKGVIDTWYTGKQVGEIWGFKSDGLIQAEGEAMADQSKYHDQWGPGDMKYKDLNGDGVINDGQRTLDDHGDLTVIGNNQPRYNIGITGGVNWKQFDFSMFWQGVGKQDYYPQLNSPVFWGMTRAWAGSAIFRDSHNLDYWRPADETNLLGPNTDAYLPKPYFTTETEKNRQVQSRYLVNAAYLRLRNIQLGYTLPGDFTNRFNISSVRVYVSGENLLLISSVPKVFDPETMIASDKSFGGYQTTGIIYPNTRSFSLGLNITF